MSLDNAGFQPAEGGVIGGFPEAYDVTAPALKASFNLLNNNDPPLIGFGEQTLIGGGVVSGISKFLGGFFGGPSASVSPGQLGTFVVGGPPVTSGLGTIGGSVGPIGEGIATMATGTPMTTGPGIFPGSFGSNTGSSPFPPTIINFPAPQGADPTQGAGGGTDYTTWILIGLAVAGIAVAIYLGR